MPPEQKYEDAFEQARNRYRTTGAGGVSMPGGPSAPARNGAVQAESTVQVPPTRNVIMKNGVVMIGGANVKTKENINDSNYGILDYGKKSKETGAK